MKLTVLDTCTVTNGDISLRELEELGEVTFRDIVEPARLPEVLRDAEGVICNKARLTAEILGACPRLRYIGLFATGYNNIDLEAAAARGIPVCNVPGYSTRAVAQHVFAMILQWAGHLEEYNASVHRGEWVASRQFSYFPYAIEELAGKTLAIYGFGAIGHEVARLGLAFRMQVVACSRTPKPTDGVTFLSPEELFAQADYLTLHCPLTEQTRHLVNDRTLALMKPTAVLINTARGGVVEEEALTAALREGRLRGAGIDVLDEEPMREGHPYLTAPHCLITPHIGWAAREARVRLITLVAENVRAFEAGHPQNVVNRPR